MKWSKVNYFKLNAQKEINITYKMILKLFAFHFFFVGLSKCDMDAKLPEDFVQKASQQGKGSFKGTMTFDYLIRPVLLQVK